MATEFNIKITVDGRTAKAQAGRLREAIEKELGRIEVSGMVDVAGLEQAQKQMAALRKDAGALGRAIAQGLGQQWRNLEQKLADVQSQITGIVRAGEKTNIAADMLDAMPELEDALTANDKKTLNLTLKMQDLTARTNELTRSIAELGRVQVQPLSGGQIRTLSELFKGLSERYTKGKIKKAVKAIDQELEPLEQQIDAQLEDAIGALQERRAELNAEIAKTAQAIQELEEIKPAMPTVFGVELTEEQQAWEQKHEALIEQYEAQNRELDAVRSEIVQGDAQQLRDELLWRRRELEKPLEEEFEFWREWSMGSVKEIADALRAAGQGAAAKSLEQMEAAFEERKRLQTQIKRAFGGLQKGGEAELPQGAEGTLVDFVAAERTLGKLADTATDNLKAQSRALRSKTRAFDDARLAAEGFNEAERKAISQLQKAAQREIRGATKASVPMDEAAAAEREILGRLALEVRSVTEAMDQALDEATEEARAAATAMEQALDEPVAEEAEEEARGLLRIWQWVSDRLVGHSVIPEMVTAINEWLALIGEDAAQQNREQVAAAEEKARALIELAEMEMRAGIEAEKRMTEVTRAQAKARLAERTEEARQATIQERGGVAVDVAVEKSAIREQERQNKLLTQARTLAAELGLEWSNVEAEMTQSGDTLEDTIGGLKRMKREQAAANREAQQQTRLTEDAQRSTQALGLDWAYVERITQQTGVELRDVVSELRRAEQEQARLNTEAREFVETYSGAGGGARLFFDELEQQRQSRQGLFQMAGEFQDIGNSIRMNAGIVSGAVAVAGRDYVNFAKQSDVAARSLALNSELTQELRQATIEQSAALAVMDPETTARGVTVWAQATGQQIENQAQLNNLLEQTEPIQQAAALSQTDVATLSDATAGAINQYGLTLADTTRVVAIFNKVSDDTLAEVSDVAEGFKMVGPTADRAGESIEETAIAFSILGDNGIRGTQAGTSYGRMLDNLLIPKSKEAEEVLTDLFGSTDVFYDAEGNFIGTAQAVDMLAAAMEDMNDQEREVALGALFDTNAARAATVLIREQTEARQEGVNVLRESAASLGEDALAVWETQLSDWEESDVYRVQQAEMRWKAFWLTVGQQGLDLALPYLEKGAKVIEDITSAVQANPWMTEVITGVATGAIVVGTVITAIGTVSKMILSLRTIGEAYRSTILKQQSAEVRFRNTVVSSAEQFRAIITEAATQAATTEQAGAGAENTIEAQGAAAENAIEAQGAMAENAIEASGAGGQAVGGAAAAGGETAAAAGGGAAAVLGPILATLGGIIAGGGIYDRLVENDVGIWSGKANLERWASVAGLGAGNLVGAVTGDEDLGTRWFTAIAEKFGELEPEIESHVDGLSASLQEMRDETGATNAAWSDVGAGMASSAQETEDTWNDVGVGVARAAREAGDGTEDLTDELYEYNRATNDAARLTADQTQADEIYIELLRQQAQAVEDFNDRVAEATRDLNTDLAKLEQDYIRQQRETTADFQESQIEQEAEFHRRQAQAAAEHQKRMQRMEEDHYMRMWDLSLSRDAAGMIEENRRYDVEKRRAEEDFTDRKSQDTANFQREHAERERQHAEQMAQMQAQYLEQKQARLDQYAERVAELEREHDEEMARLEQEYFDKLNAELQYYALSEGYQKAYHQAMLNDAQTWLQSKRQLWLNYVQSLPVPQEPSYSSADRFEDYMKHSNPQGYASGGYVAQTGPALVHAGEFVMSAQTARQIEGSLGTLSQSKLTQALGGASISVPVNIDGMGLTPTQVARIAGQQVETQLLQVLEDTGRDY